MDQLNFYRHKLIFSIQRMLTQFSCRIMLACWHYRSLLKEQSLTVVFMLQNQLFRLGGNYLSKHNNTFVTCIISRLYMEELVHYLENSPKSKRTSRWKRIVECLPAPLSSALRPEDWKEIYSLKGINAALAKVRMVGFNEKIVWAILLFPRRF